MNAPIRSALLVVLSVVAIAPDLASQQLKQVGFWKKKGSVIHNTNSGNVGIGTTNPSAKLDVAGSVAVNGSQVIDGSGQWVGDPTGLIGPVGPMGPMGLPGGVVSFGTGNTRGGTDALRNNTSGAFNTAFGYKALRYNTTGLANTASGSYALFLNTTGSSNTASGFRALVFNTTGLGNTASGNYALYSNTTGYLNMASGAFCTRVAHFAEVYWVNVLTSGPVRLVPFLCALAPSRRTPPATAGVSR